MALSKEVVLDRLKIVETVFVHMDDALMRIVSLTAKEAIALINSTDVAEVEKLRARVLELEAERDRFRSVAQRPCEMNGPVLWWARDKDQHTSTLFPSRPQLNRAQEFVGSRGEPFAVFGPSFGGPGDGQCIPLYAGAPITPEPIS